MDTATTLVEALGGWDNISNLEACITRIRLDAANTDLIDEAKLPQHMYAMLAATAGVTSVSVAGDTVDALPVMVPSEKSVFGEAHYSFTLAPTLGFDHAEATGAALPATYELAAWAPDALLGPAWPAIYAALGSAIHNDYPVIEGLLNAVHL